jgi:1-aminocyclopropane-1-carboxylate deaminase/D-cysteine desulfhydrase-like pyridoxal-dependent ACC family enzyme
MARAGALKAEMKVLFIHTGGMPALYAYEGVVLGEA